VLYAALAEGVRMERSGDVNEFRKSVTIYHSFPSLTALVFVGLFLLTFLLSWSYWLSALAASIPAVPLLWRWSVAGRFVDKSGCPRCGKSWKGKLTWTHPPATCPHCGVSIKDLLNS
jgi:hypothetical protein